MITEYVKGKPYFSDVKNKIKQFPYLCKNITCDVLIIGAGIDGSIANYYFTNDNIDTVLIDKGRIGYSNTSCATALLEYQLDDHANDLKDSFAKSDLANAYRIGISALAEIDSLMKKLGNKCHYSPRDTLIYTLAESEAEELKREYEFRINNGFDVSFITKENNPFNFKLVAGILAKNGGAEFNPYLFTKQMIDSRNKKFSKVFEHTEAKEIITTPTGFRVITNYGIEITCNKIIASTGYNSKLFTSAQLCEKFISYTIVTSPVPHLIWSGKTLLQDNSDPYHYMRLSPDNRIIIGGEDIPFKNDTIKVDKANKKYAALLGYLETIYPHMKGKFNVDYQFCGAFSSTRNNLALIGKSDKVNLWFNLGYGANGIIYSIFGGKLLLDLYYGKTNGFESYFSPMRKLP